MADIINLRRARKQRNRAASKANAAANRLSYGRNKAERKAADIEKQRLNRTLDGAKREPE